MKLQTTTRDTSTLNIGKVVKAKFDTSARSMGKMSKIVRDKLYTYKALAPVRELFCNALDIHAKIGSRAPIEIDCPTNDSLFFRIRDYGTGLTPEGVEFYTTVLASDKDEDDTQIGGFGLGSKAPFAYTDQYMMRSFVDGLCYVYSVFLDEKDEVAYTLMSVNPTEEPNGLEITIPVEEKDVWLFRQNIQKVTAYTFPHRLTLKGVQHRGEARFIFDTDTYAVAEKNSPSADDECSVLIGPITYPVPKSVLEELGFNSYSMRGVIIRAQIGEIELSPTREALSLDVRSMGILKARLLDLKADSQKRIDEALTKETSEWARICKLSEIRRSHSMYGEAKSDLVPRSFIPAEENDESHAVTYKGERGGPARYRSPMTVKRYEPVGTVVIMRDTDKRILARITHNQDWIETVVKRNNASKDIVLMSEEVCNRLGVTPSFKLSELPLPLVNRVARKGRRIYEYKADRAWNSGSDWKVTDAEGLPGDFYYVPLKSTDPVLDKARNVSAMRKLRSALGMDDLYLYGIPQTNLDLVKDDPGALNFEQALLEEVQQRLPKFEKIREQSIADRRFQELFLSLRKLDVIAKVDDRLSAMIDELQATRLHYADRQLANAISDAFPSLLDMAHDYVHDVKTDPVRLGYLALLAKNPILSKLLDTGALNHGNQSVALLEDMRPLIKLPTLKEFKTGVVTPKETTEQSAA